jgi:uncharacterized protein
VREGFFALVSGLLFAAGLGVSGMTQPGKVIGFLDFAGAWDPSLALVMLGAVSVYAVVVRTSLGRARSLPLPKGRIDGRLLGGAALFGIGWGLAGFCPGPALVAAGGGVGQAMVFVTSMLVGMLAFRFFEGRRRALDETIQGGNTC